MTSRPIGLYDSGVGGLTVLKEFRKQFPHETFVYFADTLNLPYGQKTKGQIVDYSRTILSWFQNTINAKMVIAACHTSSALALDELAPQFEIPVIGTIYPLLKEVIHDDSPRRLGIIATPVSAESRTHETLLRANGFSGEILSIGCKDFVPLIESGRLDSQELFDSVAATLKPFETFKPDALIFGCTHYPFIKPIIESILHSSVQYIDPAATMAREAHLWLEQNRLHNASREPSTLQFYCSDDATTFELKLRKLLALSDHSVRCLNIHAA